MKPILTSIATGALVAPLAASQPQSRYRIVNVGTLGGMYNFGFGINRAGEVAGAAARPDDGFSATAYLWNKYKGMTRWAFWSTSLCRLSHNIRAEHLHVIRALEGSRLRRGLAAHAALHLRIELYSCWSIQMSISGTRVFR